MIWINKWGVTKYLPLEMHVIKAILQGDLRKIWHYLLQTHPAAGMISGNEKLDFWNSRGLNF